MCGHTPLASWLLAFGFSCTLRTMTTGCVFCSIVEGTAAAERVYEDDFVVAIMDIHPATAGHVLVIPRNHSQDLWHIGREDAEKAMAAAVRIAGMIRRALGPGGINLVHATGHAAWQSVFHFHLHLVPRYEDDGLVPPWPLDQPRGEEASLRVVADKLRSVSAAAAATQASSQAGPAG
jgi:histidine triad (HIT) family protein